MVELSSYFDKFAQFVEGGGQGLNKQGLMNFAEIASELDRVGNYKKSILELIDTRRNQLKADNHISNEERETKIADMMAFRMLLEGFNREMTRTGNDRYLEFRIEEPRSATHLQTLKDFFIQRATQQPDED